MNGYLLVPMETSSGLRKNCDDRSESVDGAGSWMTTDCVCVCVQESVGVQYSVCVQYSVGVQYSVCGGGGYSVYVQYSVGVQYSVCVQECGIVCVQYSVCVYLKSSEDNVLCCRNNE